MAKNTSAHAGDRRHMFSPWVGKIPCRREWQPIPVLLPGESHGQRSQVGYSPWGCKELDTTEATDTNYTNMQILLSQTDRPGSNPGLTLY